MDFDEDVVLAVEKALKSKNPALFCSYEGHPISFHAVVNESEKGFVTGLKRTLSGFGGSYVSKYENMTPYTLLLVTDLGFRKKRFNRPAISITYVGDCVHSNKLLDINDYLHPWDNQERWKTVNLFDVAYYRRRKFQCSLDLDSISNVSTFPRSLEESIADASSSPGSSRAVSNFSANDRLLEITSFPEITNKVQGPDTCGINPESESIANASAEPNSSQVVDISCGNNGLLKKTTRPEISNEVNGNRPVSESSAEGFDELSSSRVVDNSGGNYGLLEKTLCPAEISNTVKQFNTSGRKLPGQQRHPELKSITKASSKSSSSKVVKKSSGNYRLFKNTTRPEISDDVTGTNISGRKLCVQPSHPEPQSVGDDSYELNSSRVGGNSTSNDELLEKTSHPFELEKTLNPVSNRVEQSMLNSKVPVVVLRKCPDVDGLNLSKIQSGKLFWEGASTKRTKSKEQKCDKICSKSHNEKARFPQKGESKSNNIPSDSQNPSLTVGLLPVSRPKVVSKALKDGLTSQMQSCNKASTSSPSQSPSSDTKPFLKDGKVLEKSRKKRRYGGTKMSLDEESSSDVELVAEKVPILHIKDEPTNSDDQGLKSKNPALFCSYEGHPISFHAVVNESEKGLVTGLKRTLSGFGGSYVSKYENMTPYTLLLVTDLGFRKKRFNRPAISITYVGDCVHSNKLLDVNDYLHPWDNQERWKTVNLFDVAYYRHRKFQCSLDFDSISNVSTFQRSLEGSTTDASSSPGSSRAVSNFSANDRLLEITSFPEITNKVQGPDTCGINPESESIANASAEPNSSQVVDISCGNNGLLKKTTRPEISNEVNGNRPVPESSAEGFDELSSSRVVDNSRGNYGPLEKTLCPAEITYKVKRPDTCGRKLPVQQRHPELKSITKASSKYSSSKVVKKLNPVSNRVEQSMLNSKVPVVVLRKCPDVDGLNLSKIQSSGKLFWEGASTKRTKSKEQKRDKISSKSHNEKAQFPQKGESKSNNIPSDSQNPSLTVGLLPVSRPKVVSKALKDGLTSQMRLCNKASTSSPSQSPSSDTKPLLKDGKVLEKSGKKGRYEGTKMSLDEESSSDVELVAEKVPILHIKDEPTDSDDQDYEMPVKRGRGAQDRFKRSEKAAMLEWLVERNKFRNLRGVTVWKRMEKMKICPNRTWQSLKNHFIKKLIFELDKFAFLTPEQTYKFRNPASVESSDDEEGSYLNE